MEMFQLVEELRKDFKLNVSDDLEDRFTVYSNTLYVRFSIKNRLK